VPDQRRDDRPKHVRLQVLLEELPWLAARVVFLFRERQRPRVDVGVSANDIGVRMVLNVVLVTPIFHGKTGKQRERQRCKRKVAGFRLAC